MHTVLHENNYMLNTYAGLLSCARFIHSLSNVNKFKQKVFNIHIAHLSYNLGLQTRFRTHITPYIWTLILQTKLITNYCNGTGLSCIMPNPALKFPSLADAPSQPSRLSWLPTAACGIVVATLITVCCYGFIKTPIVNNWNVVAIKLVVVAFIHTVSAQLTHVVFCSTLLKPPYVAIFSVG